MTVKLKDTNRGTEKEFDTVAEAKEQKQDMIGLGAKPEDLEIEKADTVEAEHVDHTAADNTPKQDTGQTTQEQETTENATQEPQIVESDATELPDDPDISEDPVDWLPGHFVDTIQGVPTVNRKGYAVIASKYGIDVKAEPVTLPSETDFEYAEFKAIAVTPEGEQYSGFGSAHVNRMDGDAKYLLGELAETRSMKRAVAWASGVGLTAMSEMQNEL